MLDSSVAMAMRHSKTAEEYAFLAETVMSLFP